jgi:peptidylprolyl isomerase
MSIAKNGDLVKLRYTGRLSDGRIFDATDEHSPFEFKLGMGDVIEGFDEGILGMSAGEKKTLFIPCDKAYGPVNPEYVFSVDRKNLPPTIVPEIGMGLTMGNPDGQPINVTIVNFDETSITMDANFPLAGQDLIFDIEVLGILEV